MGGSSNSWPDCSVRRAGLDAALRTLAPRMRGVVVEIGGGNAGRRGRFSPPVAQADGWFYVDVRPSVRPDVCGDAQRLPFRDAVVDTVVCLEMMEYVRQPAAALREIRRILRPAGTLILATPFLHRADSPEDYWRFTEPALRQLLDDAEFSVESCQAQGAALAVVVNIVQHILTAIPRPWWRRAMLRIASLPLRGLLWLDERLARRLPSLRTFSTGYVVLGRVESPVENVHASHA